MIVILGTVSGAGVAWRYRASHSASAEAVDSHVVGEGEVSLALKETGVVEPRQTVAVKSKVSGKIREVLVAEGDHVRPGQLLAVVEPDSQATLTLTQRRLELRRRKIEVDQKEREFVRQSKLAAQGLTPPQTSEEAERDFRTAQNYFLQDKTALNVLEREANQPVTTDVLAASADPAGLTDYRILAPIDGVVSTVKVKPGELAMSGTTGFSQEGALLMEISDQRQLEVVVNVNEVDVPKVTPGMQAKVTLAATPGKPVAGRVDRVAIAPVTDTNKLVVYPVHVSLPDRPAALRQGMSATVDLTLETIEKTIRVPVLAAFDRDGKSFVKLKNDAGAFEDREIEIGLRSDRFLQVKSGLKAKDVIAARYPKPDDAKAPGGRR